MIIYALRSANKDFEDLCSEIGGMCELEFYNDEQALLLSLHACDAILVDLDTDRKAMEKFFKAVKKSEDPKSIIVLCNSLEGKELQKHQNSRHAANIYLTYPMDIEVMKMMIEEAMNSTVAGASSGTASFSLDFGNADDLIDLDSDSHEDNESDIINLDDNDEGSESFDLSLDGPDEPSISISDEEDPGEIDLGGGDDLSLSLTEEEAPLVEEVESDLDLSETTADDSFDLGGLDLGGDEESQVSDESQKIDLNEEPISIDGDITMGGIDLSDLGEATKVSTSLTEDQEEDELDKTRPALQEELGDIMAQPEELDLSDGDATVVLNQADLNLGGDDLSIGESDDLSSIEFSIDGGSDPLSSEDTATQPVQSLDSGDGEDDFQTKLREIDEMLKEDTSVNLFDDEQEEVLPDSPDEVIEAPYKLEEDISDDEPTVNVDLGSDISDELPTNYDEVATGHSGDLLRLGETIKSLRIDREQLVKKIQNLEKNQNNQNDDLLTVQAQLDEKKIENSIMKKRYTQQIEDLNLRLELISNKRAVLEEKNKQMETQFVKLRKEKSLDANRIRSRERELEDKLELLRKDAEIQIKNRDHKILELKRRIDTLEFDIESAHIKERQSVSEQEVLEEKMGKVISTLRSAIGQLEDESELDERKKRIKKNLDV